MSVLEAPPPRFSADEVATIAAALFGLEGRATDLGSERDQTFLIDGERAAVLKISNAAEDPAQLDMEALAAQRVVQVDPAVPRVLQHGSPLKSVEPVRGGVEEDSPDPGFALR